MKSWQKTGAETLQKKDAEAFMGFAVRINHDQHTMRHFYTCGMILEVSDESLVLETWPEDMHSAVNETIPLRRILEIKFS